jgi:adenine phosphoribosyltransferase
VPAAKDNGVDSTLDDASAIEMAKRSIRDVPNFPKNGILFRDITPMLKNFQACRAVTKAMAAPWQSKVDYVAGIESRGFIFGSLVAQELGVGFIPIRKPGKLPYKTESVSYGLEYGKDTLEIHIDACPHGERVLICDDLIATGGTAAAASQLIQRIGGKVAGYSFAIELADLNGKDKLGDFPVEVLFRE